MKIFYITLIVQCLNTHINIRYFNVNLSQSNYFNISFKNILKFKLKDINFTILNIVFNNIELDSLECFYII